MLVVHEIVDLDGVQLDAKRGLAGTGAPGWPVHALLESNNWLAAGHWVGVTDEVAKVTGRTPRTFDRFAGEHQANFGGQPS